jgi:N-acetylglucosamine-6-phosphate deacetylase
VTALAAPRHPAGQPRLLLVGRVHRGGASPPAEGAVLVEDGVITWVGAGRPPGPPATVVEAPEGALIAPGFIDLQVNGACGEDAADGPDAIAAISAALPASGVTAYLPTITSRPLPEMARFALTAGQAGGPGAEVLGAHLEGPFLNPERSGAHDPGSLLAPSPERVEQLLDGRPRMVTLAPELPGATAAIIRLTRSGTVVAAGHTAADYETARLAIEAGVTFGTHVFNAMAHFHHRHPGVVGALLDDRRVTVGMVADGQHLHPATCSQILRGKGWRRVALTTDQTAAAGMPPGPYRLSGREVISDGTVVRLPAGPLAGSAATMDALVRNLVRLSGIRPETAIAMASAVPARCLGLRGRGAIRPGCRADLVVLDSDLRVRATVVAGRLAYRR